MPLHTIAQSHVKPRMIIKKPAPGEAGILFQELKSFSMRMMVVMMMHSRRRSSGINYVKMTHHSGLMMFQDMTMIHPTSRTVIRHPRDFNCAPWRKVNGVLPTEELRRLTINLKYLKEKSVQVKWVIHQTSIPYFPYLEFTNFNWMVWRMHLTVNKEVNAPG